MKTTATKYFLPIIIFTLIAFFYLNGKNKHNRLLEDFVITHGKITYFGFSAGSSGAGAEYEFKASKEIYKGTFVRSIFCYKPNDIEEKIISTLEIPIAYNKKDPSNNKILLLNEDYEEFKISRLNELNSFYLKYIDCE